MKYIPVMIIVNITLAVIIWFLLRLLSIQIPQIFVQIPYQPANIVVDVANSKGPLHPFWRGFSQGGEETGGMLSPTVGKMQALKPTYVRLDHIFDDEYYGVVSGSSGNLKFNWSRLDREVEAIQAMGAKPFFSLGYFPSALARTRIDAPYNWADWTSLVRATIEHYSGVRAKNIAGVYYEVWNEPNLEVFGKWGRGGSKNYLSMYEFASLGAQAATGVQQFYLGGPATGELYQNWMIDLYNFCQTRNLRLDFLSWHVYSQDPNRFSREVAALYSWFGNKSVPRLVISEWGPTPEKSTSYSGNWAAAHAMAVVRQLLDLVNLATVFEIKDGPGQGTSGWGILTHASAPKPRYQAFLWLSQVGGQRLSLVGEGTNVTGWATKETGKISVYLVNFGAGAALEGVPVEITGLEDGFWQILREVMFGSKSEEMIQVAGGGLKTTLELQPNQVGRIILTK